MKIKTDKLKEAEPIPAGVYKTEAVSCSIVDKNASLELEIIEGEFAGRKVFYWIRGKFLASVVTHYKDGIRRNEVSQITSKYVGD